MDLTNFRINCVGYEHGNRDEFPTGVSTVLGGLFTIQAIKERLPCFFGSENPGCMMGERFDFVFTIQRPDGNNRIITQLIANAVEKPNHRRVALWMHQSTADADQLAIAAFVNGILIG